MEMRNRREHDITGLTLNELLQEIRGQHLILTWSHRRGLVLWAPNTRVSMVIRRAIAAHRLQLQRLVNESDIRVCPAKDLHRKFWRHKGGQHYICEMCARLDAAMKYYAA